MAKGYTGNGHYKPEMCKQVIELYQNGESDVEVAVALDICKQTFYEWVREKPEFAAAVRKGKSAAEVWWQKLGRAGAAGKVNIQARVWLANMKNRFDWVESERSEQHITLNVHENSLKDLK